MEIILWYSEGYLYKDMPPQGGKIVLTQDSAGLYVISSVEELGFAIPCPITRVEYTYPVTDNFIYKVTDRGSYFTVDFLGPKGIAPVSIDYTFSLIRLSKRVWEEEVEVFLKEQGRPVVITPSTKSRMKLFKRFGFVEIGEDRLIKYY